jgi:uncharacterized protein (DUF1778 family)
MKYQPLPFPDRYSDRLIAAVPAPFGRAIRAAAARAGLTVADFVRVAVAERATEGGIECPRLPILSNSTYTTARLGANVKKAS